jgi:hypothetical protein
MPRLRWIAYACTLLLAGAGVGAGAAQAHLLGLSLGFSADPLLTGPDAGATSTWIPRAVAENAQIVRVNVTWSGVAPATRPAGFDPSNPASPGYDWTATDDAVRALTSFGLKVLINITLAPNWAQGAGRPAAERGGTWYPNPAQFADFATAAARRYDGGFPDPLRPGASLPAVRYWQAWNEPNLDYYLSPQWTNAGGVYTNEAPIVYRRLLNAFYAAVKAVSSSNFVTSAGTAPYGDPAGADRIGAERTQPVAFDRALFCLNDDAKLTPTSCPNPPHLDALSHHPYGVGGPLWHAVNADDAAVPDFYKIAGVLKAAERAGHVLPAGPKQLWDTEISWDSSPPDPQGVPINEHARWLEQALFVLWKQGVDTVLWLQIADSPPIPSYAATNQGGTYYLSGQPKPAAQAYRFPFVTQRLNRRRIEAWGRAPQGGRLRIQVRHGRHWKTVKKLRVKSEEVYLVKLKLRGRAKLRAKIGGQRSLTWSQGR